MQVFAHRGFSGLYPENTMYAFVKALEAGADGIELDIHASKDGQLVIIHDEQLVRTTGCQGLVSDYTLEELTHIKASRTKDDAFDAYIPSLEEYCDFVSKNNLITNIEIKTNVSWYAQIEQQAVQMVRAFHLEDRVVFSSFNWLSVARCKALAPDIACGLLYEGKNIQHLAYEAKDAGLQYLHPDYKLLNLETIDECRVSGVGLNVWTVNEEQQMRRLMELDVHGVISNYPDMCLRLLGR